MSRGPVHVLVGLVLASVVSASRADADQQPDYQQKATAAFALGHYAEAGESFEKAFAASPEPALLYNAAQAYRLAGNKERALTLYENYLRVYGGGDKQAELESRIEELKKAIEHDKAVATKPPNETVPVSAAAAAPAALPSASPPADRGATPVLVDQPTSSASEHRPLTSKVWFWSAIGAVVVAAVVVGVVVATGGSKDPTPSLGKVNGI